MKTTTAKHTPGPWVVLKHPRITTEWWIGTADKDSLGLSRETVALLPSHKINEANASLIAAAPRLYKALLNLLEFASEYGPSQRASMEDWSGPLNDGYQAIAEAEGRA